MTDGDIQELLSRSLDAHIETNKENLRHFEAMARDMAKQTALLERQTEVLEKAVSQIAKSEARLVQVESSMSEKLGALLTNLKVQWVTMSIGMAPICIYSAKTLWQSGG